VVIADCPYGVTRHVGSTGNAGGSAGFEPRPGHTIVTEILRGFLQSAQENFGTDTSN
jgi:hypothetical protein